MIVTKTQKYNKYSIELTDHLIITDNDYLSLKAENII